MKIDIELLKSEIKKFKNILVLTHNNPDPDAMCAGMMLQEIFKVHGVHSKLSHGGFLKRRENVKMVSELNIDICPFSEINVNDFDGFALVDTQSLSGNHILPADKQANFVVDHHLVDDAGGGFRLVDPNVGATATIMLDCFKLLDMELDTRLATAYCYSIQADTREFSREFSQMDVNYYKEYIHLANLPQIARIKQAKKPIGLYDAFKEAISNKVLRGDVLVTYIGEVESVDYIPEIADMFCSVETVSVVMVVGFQSHSKKYTVSTRTDRANLDLSKVTHDLSNRYNGSGGGHAKMAAGIFEGDYKKFIEDFLTEVGA